MLLIVFCAAVYVPLASAVSKGDCVCITGTSVNIRDTPCGTIVDTKSKGYCYIATGASITCSLSGKSYVFWEFSHGLGTAWTAASLLALSPSRCSGCERFKLVTRREWNAAVPTGNTALGQTSKYFIHHSAGPNCTTPNSCKSTVKSIQTYHITSNKWWDIGYNFLVGEDGNAYEGRGWTSQGAHAPDWNSRSIGICIMGTYTSVLPNQAALNTVLALMECGASQVWMKIC